MSYLNSHSCPRKSQARHDTIISTYQSLFHNSLPENKQYYTLSGPINTPNTTTLGENSELNQLLQAKLITPNQYHGIDYNKSIITQNKLTAPQANFYHGDFYKTLASLAENPNHSFNPAIIHADFIHLIKKSSDDIGNILYLLNSHNITETLLIINLPYNNPYKDRSFSVNPHNIWNTLADNQRFQMSINNWNVLNDYYLYGGTGEKTRTTMISFILHN